MEADAAEMETMVREIKHNRLRKRTVVGMC